jgi:hypothetical protein
VFQLRSAVRGKFGRGFKHFGGSSEVDTLGDVLVGAGLTRWQALIVPLAATMLDIDGNVWTPFIKASYLTNYKTNPTVVRGVNVTSSLLNLEVATMRKRKSKTTH